jgi:hypothetical protein
MIRRILLALHLVKPRTQGEEKIVAALSQFVGIVESLFDGSEEIQEEIDEKLELAEELIQEARNLRKVKERANAVRANLLKLMGEE